VEAIEETDETAPEPEASKPEPHVPDILTLEQEPKEVGTLFLLFFYILFVLED
jgi:hypothetical protein